MRNDKYENISATVIPGEQRDSIEFSDEDTNYRFSVTPNNNDQMKLLKEFIPRFIILYKDKQQDGILLSTYSRSIFDYEKLKPTADELIDMLRRHKERLLLNGNESSERLSQLMFDLAIEMEDQLKL